MGPRGSIGGLRDVGTMQKRHIGKSGLRSLAAVLAAVALVGGLAGCGAAAPLNEAVQGAASEAPQEPLLDDPASAAAEESAQEAIEPEPEPTLPEVEIHENFVGDFSHGTKTAEFQKYIVLHDTEGGGTPYDVIDGWKSDGNYIASHFIIGKDGEIVQCVPMDDIAHHAGFGDAGHNSSYGTTDESRDDKRGTSPIGDWAPDYGMNSYSIGIEMIHQGSTDEDYPEAQLEALDALISYIDAYYGFESEIIDHKAWRSGNSDTSPEFAGYLANYQATRTHDGQ